MSSGDSMPAVLEAGARDHKALPSGGIRGEVVWAYAELLDALALASRWEPAIRQADPDADRFARAVRLRARDVLDAERRITWPAPLVEAATLLADLTALQFANDAAALLARVPLPVRQTELFQPSSQAQVQPDSDEHGSGTPPVALIIEHRGEPILRPTPLTPGAMHQLEIEARLASWPDGVEELAVDFLSVQPPEYLYVSPVTFSSGQSRQPLEIRIAGERPPEAPPLQVTARASFRSGTELLPARLVGNTTLELVTFDPGTANPRNCCAPRCSFMSGTLVGGRRAAAQTSEGAVLNLTAITDNLSTAGLGPTPERTVTSQAQGAGRAGARRGARQAAHGRRPRARGSPTRTSPLWCWWDRSCSRWLSPPSSCRVSLHSNLPTAARRLMQMMGELRNAILDLPSRDQEDLRMLIEGVLRFAHTVLNDHLDAEWDRADEAWFQGKLAYFLRADPRIGARLQEHTRLGGGITDLILGNIVLELKVERDRPVSQDDARRYTAQATQYGSGNDTQVSLLAMLDISRKRAPAGVMGNELFWVYPQTATGEPLDFPSMVGVIIIRGNFPRPSDFSR
jgi:hypothetical protein